MKSKIDMGFTSWSRTLVTIGYIHSCKKIDYFLQISEKNKIPGIFPKVSSSAKNSKALR